MSDIALSEKPRQRRGRLHIKALIRGKKINRSRAGTLFLLLFLFAGAAVMALPMVLIISNAFKPHDELLVFPPQLIPHNPTMKNFRDMFNVLSASYVPFLRFIFNSVFGDGRGIGGPYPVILHVCLSLSQKEFPGPQDHFSDHCVVADVQLHRGRHLQLSDHVLAGLDRFLPGSYRSGVRIVIGPVPDEAVYGATPGFADRGGADRRGRDSGLPSGKS